MKDARVSIFVRGIIPRLIDRNLIGSATSLVVGNSRFYERNHAIIPAADKSARSAGKEAKSNASQASAQLTERRSTRQRCEENENENRLLRSSKNDSSRTLRERTTLFINLI